MKPRTRRKKQLHVGNYLLLVKRGTYCSIKKRPTQLIAVEDAIARSKSSKPADLIIVVRIYHIMTSNRSKPDAKSSNKH